jgi:hypothetical protein
MQLIHFNDILIYMPWYSEISVYLIFLAKFCMHTSHKTWIVVHYRVIDNPSLVPIMIEKNPVHSLQPYSFNINFSNIFPSTFRCLKKFWFFWLFEVFGNVFYEAVSNSDCVVSNSVVNDELKRISKGSVVA